MKTISFLSALLLLSTSTMASAPVTAPPSTTPTALERELKHQIDKYVTYPIMSPAREMEGEVIVSFVIDAVGKVRVISALSENDALCTYVLKMLSKVDVGDNPIGTWRTTHMRFRFRPEA